MYRIKTDLHVHSIFTDHAYSTIQENAHYAASKEMELIAITDHFGPMFIHNTQSALFHFMNRVVIPSELEGVTVLRGVEADIIDFDGNLAFMDEKSPIRTDISIGEHVLRSCEFVIASVHQNPDFHGGDKLSHTKMYINAIRNPFVDMIGHCGRSGMEFELDEVLKAAKDEKKIIEINNHSFAMNHDNTLCKSIAERCADLGVMIAVNSDAHFSMKIGAYENAIHMLEEIHFPEELIVNTSKERVLKNIRRDKKNI